jgi:hypothetical protein
MAILALFRGNNLTKQMYDSLLKEVGWERNQPPGSIFHAAAFDNSGNNIHVADVWESEEDLNKFVKEKLMPAMQKLNFPVPQTEVFQIHNVNAFPGIEKYRIK